MLITINESKCVGLEVVQDDLMTTRPSAFNWKQRFEYRLHLED